MGRAVFAEKLGIGVEPAGLDSAAWSMLEPAD